MTALRKIRIEEEPVVAATEAARAPAKLYVVTNNVPAEAAAPEKAGSALKNIALFFAAPFIGLVYIVAFPFVGLARFGRAGWPPRRQIRNGPGYRPRAAGCRNGGCRPGARPRLHRAVPLHRPGGVGLDGRPRSRRALNELDQCEP